MAARCSAVPKHSAAGVRTLLKGGFRSFLTLSSDGCDRHALETGVLSLGPQTAQSQAERVRRLRYWPKEGEVLVRPVHELREELNLGDGRTNPNYIVHVDGSLFFVRVGEDLPAFGISRDREIAASRAAHAAGLAPQILHVEPPAMVQEFVSGRALAEMDLHIAVAAAAGSQTQPATSNPKGSDAHLLGKILEALRQLHAIPVPRELHSFQATMGTVGWGGPHLVKRLTFAEQCAFSRLPLLPGLREFLDRLEEAAGSVGPPKFCHFDFFVDNIILQNSGSIFFVDFEYSAPGQPLMDLAILAASCSLDEESSTTLLAGYLLRKVSEVDMRQFQALQVLAAIFETLWYVVAETSKSSAISLAEARNATDRCFERYLTMRRCFEDANGISH